jgi:hypothetical protein
MTPETALIELLARVGARGGAAVFVSAEELDLWPALAVAAMKVQGLLRKAHPAVSTVCPGCEQQCVMPVHTVPAGRRSGASFIVCDKRSDINRVHVSTGRLKLWRCDADALVGFIAACLGLRRSNQPPSAAGVLNVGMVQGEKRRQMLSLRVDGAEWFLVSADSTLPLAELVAYDGGEYFVDAAMVRQLVDSATTADQRYTPSNARREARKLNTRAMYESWRRAYRDLKKRRLHMSDVWYAQQIAKLTIGAGRSAETIRRRMKT